MLGYLTIEFKYILKLANLTIFFLYKFCDIFKQVILFLIPFYRKLYNIHQLLAFLIDSKYIIVLRDLNINVHFFVLQ